MAEFQPCRPSVRRRVRLYDCICTSPVQFRFCLSIGGGAASLALSLARSCHCLVLASCLLTLPAASAARPRPAKREGTTLLRHRNERVALGWLLGGLVCSWGSLALEFDPNEVEIHRSRHSPPRLPLCPERRTGQGSGSFRDHPVCPVTMKGP